MRRQASRYAVTHPVELVVAGVRHGATLGDLSRTGMFVRMPTPLPIGIGVKITMAGAEGSQLQTRGTVVRRTLGVRPGIGVVLREPCEPSDDLFGLGVEHLLRRAAVERASPVLTGELSEIGLATILTMLEYERKTCRLVIGEFTIDVVEGRIVDAGIAGKQVDAWTAVMKALDLRDGRFDVFRCTPAVPSFGLLPITHLLLDHARVTDELRASA